MYPRSITLLALIVITVLFGAGAFSPGSALAAAVPEANVGSGSCNEANTGSPDEAFCSWDGFGEAPVIGPNSCTVASSCTFLGGGVTINAGGDLGQPGSCTAVDACRGGGADFGSMSIGNGSCTVADACTSAGSSRGSISIGNDSCTGQRSCQGAGAVDGSMSIGNGSCTAVDACVDVGVDGSSIIGNGSCTAADACTAAGSNGGISIVGNDSCTGERSCYLAGSFGGSSSIGNHSCNYYNTGSAGAFNAECAEGIAGDIGDCMYNEAPFPPACTGFCGPDGANAATGALFDFTEACAAQAACTADATGWAVSSCNRVFYNDMVASCRDQWGQSRSASGKHRLCRGIAQAYYFGAFSAPFWGAR